MIVSDTMSLTDAVDKLEGGLGQGMPVLPLRRTFFPGASGVDGLGAPPQRQVKYYGVSDLGQGMPVLPLRRTFFPGASGVDGLGDFTYSYTHPRTGVKALRGYKFITTPGPTYGRQVLESFHVAGVEGLGQGMPVLPLRRTFFPGASGMDDVGNSGGVGHRWVVLDSAGNIVAVFKGRPRRIASGYSFRKAKPTETFNNVPQYTMSGMGDDDASMFGDNDASMFDVAAEPGASGLF